jgi:hypothetical protein
MGKYKLHRERVRVGNRQSRLSFIEVVAAVVSVLMVVYIILR